MCGRKPDNAVIKALWLMSLALLFLLQGCGAEDIGAEDRGDVVIGITDAEGDFLNYAVDVTGLTLTKANGAVVDVLPVSTRIDFADLTEMTEFFTIATIPAGRYVKATLTLDYRNADVQVEDANGDPVAVTVKDSGGNPLTTWKVAVNLSNANSLVIAPGVPAHLTLDFDLNASHTVDTDVSPIEVIAQPVLVADVKLEDPKPHRVRGLLQSVDQGAGTFRMNLRPFFHHAGQFGAFTVHVNNATAYEIDGASYSGADGLAQLAKQTANSRVVVFGELNPSKQFVATEVYAGSSVPGADQDVVTGVVLKRTGDTLTVNAGSIVRSDGSLIFNKDITITLDSGTVVKRQLAAADYTKDDLSVGQRIVAWGTLDSAADHLNAPAQVRMLVNQFTGTVMSNSGGELVMDLQRLNGRLPARFDFAGTGSGSANDADPNHYQIDLGTLTPTVSTGDPVKVRGFVAPFGSAPQDFEATTVIDVAEVPAVLAVGWGLFGTATPFTPLESNRLVLNEQGVGVLHHVSRAWVNIDLTADSQDTTLVPAATGSGVFTINQAGTIYMYFTFSEFVTALTERVNAGHKTQRIWAVGAFDDATATLTAGAAGVVMF